MDGRGLYDQALQRMNEAARMGAQAKEQLGLARQLIIQELIDRTEFVPSERDVPHKLALEWQKLLDHKSEKATFIAAGTGWVWRLARPSWGLVQLSLEPEGIDDALQGLAFMSRQLMPIAITIIDVAEPQGREDRESLDAAMSAFHSATEQLIRIQLSGERIRPMRYETKSVAQLHS